MLQICADKYCSSISLNQEMVRPVIYLDHWAVRLFSNEDAIRKRFLSALKGSGGTWLFSTANLFEFTAMDTVDKAVKAEELLFHAFPNLYFADTTLDPGFLFVDGAIQNSDAPERGWMLNTLADRIQIAKGQWNTKRFIQDAVNYSDLFRPLFCDMKSSIIEKLGEATNDADLKHKALTLRLSSDYSMRDVLEGEVLREHFINPNYKLSENDAMDLIHAIPAALIADFVLLDKRWCHKIERAAEKLRRYGVKGNIAKCFHKRLVSRFLSELDIFACGGNA